MGPPSTRQLTAAENANDYYKSIGLVAVRGGDWGLMHLPSRSAGEKLRVGKHS